MPIRTPQVDAVLVRRLRRGDPFIPPEDFQVIAAKRGGDGRISNILFDALEEGTERQRRLAVGAVCDLVLELVGDPSPMRKRRQRRSAQRLPVTTEEVIAAERQERRQLEATTSPGLIKARRLSLEMTPQEVATAAEIALGDYERIETGEADPPFSVVVAISEALKLPVASLLDAMNQREEIARLRERGDTNVNA